MIDNNKKEDRMRILKTAASVLVVGAMASACADSSRSLNPTAPSAVVVSSASSLSGDGDAGAVSGATGGPKEGKGKPDNPGNGNGNKPDNPGNGKPDDPGKPENPGRPDSPGNSSPPGLPPSGNTTPPAPGNTTPPSPVVNRVQIEGVIGAIGTGTIDVNGQIVTVPSTAVIRQGAAQFVFADLLVGDPVHVVAQRTVIGSAVSLAATEVKLQRDDPDDEDEEPPTLLISVGALDGAAAEAGLDPGTFRFSRSGDTTASLTVAIELSGTAINGTDYGSLPLTVSFAAGSAIADLSVVPLADAIDEGSESVIVTVVDGADYDPGSPATATVTIAG
jgi:hypothetical protein